MTKPFEAQRYLHDVVMTFEGDECLTWPFSVSKSGRAMMTPYWWGGTQSVAREVCERVHGWPPTPQHQAAHSCGKGHLGCVNPKHISWKTPAANNQDRIGHGTWLGKLNEAAVRELRALGPDRPTLKVLGEKYGCSHVAIRNVLLGKTWAWVDADEPRQRRAAA